MKTYRFTAAFVLGSSLLVAGCAKEKEVGSQIELPNYTIEKGMIHFTTRGDYEKMVDMPPVALKDAFVSAVAKNAGFTSAEQALQSGERTTDGELLSLIDDPYFRALLNERLCVWIDDHIFRVNPESGMVYVIPSDTYNESFEALLDEDVQNEDVRLYPVDVNVFEELERDNALWPFCGEEGAPGFYTARTFSDGSGRLAILRYAKYGIYFDLHARVEWVNVSPTYDDFEFYFKGNSLEPGYWGRVYYRPKCGTVVNYETRSHGTYQDPFNGPPQRWFQSYQGSKGLNKVDIRWRPIRYGCPEYTGIIIGGDGGCHVPFHTNDPSNEQDAWLGYSWGM